MTMCWSSLWVHHRRYHRRLPPPATLTGTTDTPYSYDADNTAAASGAAPITFSLISGPTGMTVSAAGLVTWTPVAGQEGLNAVEIEASNLLGTDTQTFDVNVAMATLAIDDVLPMLWTEEFEGPSGPIQAYDPSWVQIFGQLNIDSGLGAVVADPGNPGTRDDYGYRPQAATDIRITADFFLDTQDPVGIELICAPGTVHKSLYELTTFNGRLQLLRSDGGGNSSIYEELVLSPHLGLTNGEYTLILRAQYDGTQWHLLGELRDLASGTLLATITETLDTTHGPSIGQGVGFFNVSGEASSIYRLVVEGS